MRAIKYIAVHCTAGSRRNTAREVVKYHTVTLGWKAPGYHYIVEADGNVVEALPVDRISNGVKGYNAVTINVAYIGGVDTSKPGLPPADTRTPAQKAALRRLLTELRRRFPDAEIRGHRDFPNVHKACPSFDAIKEYADI